jgi:hypothetical protein
MSVSVKVRVFLEWKVNIIIRFTFSPCDDVASQSHWPRGLRRTSWLLGCWERGFESRLGLGCLSLCIYVALSCVGRGLCDELITHPEES